MDDPTPAQEASAELAEAVFGNPDLLARFELMIKETAAREPKPDDFSKWLPRASMDERVKIDMDPEDALRMLLQSPKKRGESKR